MIDIHCHILPGVDDGAPSVKEAVAMARAFVADGVRTVFATSHFCHMHLVDRTIVHQKLGALQAELDRLDIGLKLLPGNEVRVESTRFFYEHLEAENFSFLGGTRKFLLLEHSWDDYNPDVPKIIADLSAQGTQVIIAHPERQYFFLERPELVEREIEAGAWIQVNAGSFIGEYGPRAKRFALELLSRGLVHTIGTDAHNTRVRRPNLLEGFRAIEKHAGPDAAQAIRDRMAEIAEASAAEAADNA